MRLTERDKEMLEAIHAFDGMMSLRQIDRLFFSGKGRTQPRQRMRTLVRQPLRANARMREPFIACPWARRSIGWIGGGRKWWLPAYGVTLERARLAPSAALVVD